jgi:hypothetical protein
MIDNPAPPLTSTEADRDPRVIKRLPASGL